MHHHGTSSFALRAILAAAAAVALAPLTAAQLPVSYPQDSVMTSSGNLVPFGYSGSRRVDEGRYQLLIPARYLPSTGATIAALAVATIPGNGTVTYDRLQITLSPTTATSLSPTFASNLPAPVTVLSATNFPVTYTQQQWSVIPFAVPFVYDGSSDLVVDVEKEVDSAAQAPTIVSMATSANPGRTDLPQPRYDFGPLGSGASRSTTGRFSSASPLKVRLLVDVPTLTLGSDRGGGSNQVFAIGGSLTATVHAQAGSVFALLAGGAFAPPAPLPLLQGLTYLVLGQVDTVATAMVPAAGSASLTAAIPNDPQLVGVRLVLQAAIADPTLTVLGWSPAVDCLING